MLDSGKTQCHDKNKRYVNRSPKSFPMTNELSPFVRWDDDTARLWGRPPATNFLIITGHQHGMGMDTD